MKTKTMRLFIIIFSVLFSFFFFSCGSSIESEGSGTITFTFGVSPARWSGTKPSDNTLGLLTHTIDLKNGNYSNSVIAEPGVTKCTVTDVPLGSLEVKIEAKMYGYPFASGKTTINIVKGDNNKADVTMNRLNYGIILSESGTCVFDSQSADYTSAQSKTIGIANYAENDTGPLTVKLSPSSSNAFTVSAASIASIAPDNVNQNAFTVAYVGGLSVGTYAANITVSGSNAISASFRVSFTVTAITPGSAGDPFLVATVEDLLHVGKPATGGAYDGWGLDKHYRQTADIDLDGLAWTPIGSSSANFTGSYDGGGYTISNLTIDNPTADYQGLFGSIKGSSTIVKNVGIVNCDIKGKGNVGGVAGANSGDIKIYNQVDNFGKVQDCYVSGIVTVSGTGDSIGGVVGYNIGTVQGCYATGDVSGNNSVGGVVGNSYFGTVQGCHATGDVSGTSAVGGVVGVITARTVQNCYATGNVTGTSSVGGVAGSISYSQFTYGVDTGGAQNCYATGTVSGKDQVGGVVGGNNISTVQYCYATGNVTGTGNYVGGVAGNNTNPKVGEWYEKSYVQNCYATGTVSGKDQVGGVVGLGNQVQNCYATGTVTGAGNNVGGVAGQCSGTLQNCAALNPNIIGIGPNVGRVVGSGTWTNNFGRDDMKEGDPPDTAVWTNNTLTGADGADITDNYWAIESWWTGTAKFGTAAWDFSDISSTSLPTLNGMPGLAQNPEVQPLP